MKYSLLFCFLLLFIGKTHAQIMANGNTGETTTAYTNTVSNDKIYIWCASGLTNNTASLTASSPTGAGTYTYKWYYHNETNSSWTTYITQTGTTSTINNLPSDGYRVQIFNSSNVLVGCYVAWVWNMNGQVTASTSPTACQTAYLSGTAAANSSFTYYNPPPPPSTITAATEISICFTATHTYVSDLAFYLVGPPSCGSPTILLSPNPGANGQGPVCNSSNNVANLCFTTSSTANLNVCSALVGLSGTYGTYGPLATPINWSPLIGCNASQGGWRVQIFDCIGADVGALRNAVISFSNLENTCGSVSSITYDSGVINSFISDNSCSPATASIFQVPVSTELTTPITINATTSLQWVSSPAVTFENPNSLETVVTNLPDGTYTFTLNETITYGSVSCTYGANTSFVSNSFVAEPINLQACGAGMQNFNLTLNNSIVNPLGTDQVSYHNTLLDAQNSTGAIVTPTIYPSAGGETIYVRIQKSLVCYDVKTFTLNKIDLATSTFDAIPSICFGAALSALPTTSNNGYSGTWSPALDNTQTTTYTFTPNVGECSTVSTLEIVVHQKTIPTFTIVPPICFEEEIATLPTTSNNGVSGTWSPALDNTQTTTYTFTPNVGECATLATLEIVVNPFPVISHPNAMEVCDDNNDGFSTFDLSLSTNEITNGNNTLVLTFHETEINAQNGVSAINPITNYSNINQNTQTIYVRVVDPSTPLCVRYETLELQVLPRPTITSVSTYALCNYSGTGFEEFDLSLKMDEILNGQTNCSVTFYLSQADADLGVLGTELPLLYQNISSPQLIWYRIQNNTSGCFSVGSFSLLVNTLPQITTPPNLTACGELVAGQGQFDLSVNTLPILNGQSGLSVTYHTSQNGANNQLDLINSATNYTGLNGEIIYVRIQNIDTGCFSTTQFSLEVIDAPALSGLPNLYYCDPNNDGFGIFDLSIAATQIASVNPAMTVTFHETIQDATANVNAVNLMYNNINQWSQTLYVRIHSLHGNCTFFNEIGLVVNQTPQAVTPQAIQVCDNNTDGFEIFNITIRESEILNGADPLLHHITYHLSEANAIANSNTISNVLSFQNTVPNMQTIWVRIEIAATGCYDIVPLQLIVNPLPVIPFPATPYELCDVSNSGDEIEEFDLGTYSANITTVPGMIVTYHFDQASATAGTPELPLQYVNQVPGVQTIFVRVTNEDTQCFTTTLLDLRVEPLPAPVIPEPTIECDSDGNGFATFTLQDLVEDILNGAPDTVISFHETYTNADLNVFPLGNTYQNVNAFVQTIYIRAQNTITGCYVVVAMELQVNASPIMPTLSSLQICDTNQDGIFTINLTQQSPILLNAQTGGSTYSIKYFTSLAAAESGFGSIVTPQTYLGTNGQTIWVVITDTVSGCFSIGSFQLQINTPLALNPAYSLSICDTVAPRNDSIAVFDLTSMNSIITGNASGYTVQYYLNFADAQSNTSPIETPEAFSNGSISGINNPYTLHVAVTNTATTCKSFTTLTIRVLPVPTPNTTPPDLITCDNVNSPNGTEIFDLTVNENYIKNNDLALTFAYFPTLADAIANSNQILQPTMYEGVGVVYIKVMNSQTDSSGNNCYVIVEQLLIVNPLPIVATIPVINAVCQQNNTGFATFTLSNSNAEVLEGSQNISDYSFTYHLNLADSQSGNNPLPNLYTNISNPQDVYVRVVNTITGCVNPAAVVTLIADDGAIANPIDENDPDIAAIITTCDDDGTNDGLHVFNLSDLDDAILGTQSTDPNFTIHYYTSLALINEDLQNGGPATTNPLAIQTPNGFVTTEAFVQTIHAVVINTASVTGCPSIVSFPLTVNVLPEPIINNEGGIICVEFETDAVLTPIQLSTQYTNATHTFQWSLGGSVVGTDETYTITTMTSATAIYSLVVTDIATGCVSNAIQTTITRSGPPVIESVQVTNAFTENQIITVIATGFGTYEYQLDNGPWQDSNVFSGVSIGQHIVSVRDVLGDQGCGFITQQALAIGYPKYFTPNGDGIHDTWNIVGLDNSAQIYIFDRYGKLLKELSPTGAGWDGTMNGEHLPSTDYWFKVIYLEQNTRKEFRSHFAMKR